MAKQISVNKLASMIGTLQKQRQEHVDALAEIDALFQSLGITPKAPARRGRKPGKVAKTASAAAPKKKRGRRRKFSETSEQFISGLLQGGKKLSTGAINKHWISSGRKNRADITLGKMVKEGKIKRQKVKGERGSMYSA